MITSEIKGYTLISHGIDYDRIQLSFSNWPKTHDFTLGLGFIGEIEINSKLTESLIKVIPFKMIKVLQHDQSVGLRHLFEKQTIQWNGMD